MPDISKPDDKLVRLAQLLKLKIPQVRMMLRETDGETCSARTIPEALASYATFYTECPGKQVARARLAALIETFCAQANLPFGVAFEMFETVRCTCGEVMARPIALRLAGSATDTQEAERVVELMEQCYENTEPLATAIMRWNELSTVEANAARDFGEAEIACDGALAGSPGRALALRQMVTFATEPAQLVSIVKRAESGSDVEHDAVRKLWRKI